MAKPKEIKINYKSIAKILDMTEQSVRQFFCRNQVSLDNIEQCIMLLSAKIIEKYKGNFKK